MNINHIWNACIAGLSMMVSLIAGALGGWDTALQVLIGCMVVDYITGLIVAGVFKKSGKSESGTLESRAGFKGLCRKGAVLGVVYICVLLDKALGVDYVRTAVCFFFTANEALSILENLGLMGVPYPAFLKSMLQALKEKGDGGKVGKV